MARINYDLQNDVLDDTQKVVTSTWSDNTNALTSVHTSSIQADFAEATSKGAFYIDVYHIATGSAGSAVQYSIAYGHKAGSGSLNFTNSENAYGISPSRVNYNQYRQLVFGDENQQFTFPGDGSTDAFVPDDIYIININRARYKNNLKVSTLNLKISGSGDGTLGILELTDDSITSTGSAVMTNAGRQFNIVSGSSGIRSGSTNIQVTNSGSYGLFYPDSGFIVLNPAAISHHITESTPDLSSNLANNNHQKLLDCIGNSSGGGGNSFIVDSEEKISSKYYFTRIKNSEFNFTTNPSFIDATGNLRYSSMEGNPKVYITTIGLYNDTDDLIAVAKLSQPIAKDFTKEALIRVKLDY